MAGLPTEVSETQSLILSLHKSCLGSINHTTNSFKTEIESLLHLEADIGQWLEILSNRIESAQLNASHRDFGLALYSATCGLYRQAFSSLRSHLEASIATIFLSASEFQRRQWVSGKIDISWSQITDPDKGLFSGPFVLEFCPEAKQDRKIFLESARSTYRHCSGYVHSEVATSQLIPKEIDFNSEIFHNWITSAESALEAVFFALFIRYFHELDDSQRQKLDAGLEERFARLISVRQVIGLPIEME